MSIQSFVLLAVFLVVLLALAYPLGILLTRIAGNATQRSICNLHLRCQFRALFVDISFCALILRVVDIEALC